MFVLPSLRSDQWTACLELVDECVGIRSGFPDLGAISS